MKTLLPLIVLLATMTGCTFFTEIDANYHAPGAGDSNGKCEAIRALLDAEHNPDARAELARAYARCLDSDSQPDPWDRPPGDCDDEACWDRPPGDCDDEDCYNRPPGDCDEADGCERPPLDPVCVIDGDESDIEAWYRICRQSRPASYCLEQAAACMGIDVVDLCDYGFRAPDEADEGLLICDQLGIDQLICSDLIDYCSEIIFPPVPPAPAHCEAVLTYVQDELGYDLPLPVEDISDIYEQCLQTGADHQSCEMVRDCLLQEP